MFVASSLTHEEILAKRFASANGTVAGEELSFSIYLWKMTAMKSGRKKSLAYRLTYRDKNRTLTNEEVNAVHAKIRERLRSDLGAELRE